MLLQARNCPAKSPKLHSEDLPGRAGKQVIADWLASLRYLADFISLAGLPLSVFSTNSIIGYMAGTTADFVALHYFIGSVQGPRHEFGRSEPCFCQLRYSTPVPPGSYAGPQNPPKSVRLCPTRPTSLQVHSMSFSILFTNKYKFNFSFNSLQSLQFLREVVLLPFPIQQLSNW